MDVSFIFMCRSVQRLNDFNKILDDFFETIKLIQYFREYYIVAKQLLPVTHSYATIRTLLLCQNIWILKIEDESFVVVIRFYDGDHFSI